MASIALVLDHEGELAAVADHFAAVELDGDLRFSGKAERGNRKLQQEHVAP
jgi:hypothetical protein